MEKYHKVFRKDYEEWYQENQEYRELTDVYKRQIFTGRLTVKHFRLRRTVMIRNR